MVTVTTVLCKSKASIDSFFGLPEQNLSKFARELVRRRYLILLV